MSWRERLLILFFLIFFLFYVRSSIGDVYIQNSLEENQLITSNISGPDIEIRFQSLSNRLNADSLCLSFRYCYSNWSDGNYSLGPRLHELKCIRLAARSHPFAVETSRCSRKFYSYIFFTRTSRLWNSLFAACFSVN